MGILCFLLFRKKSHIPVDNRLLWITSKAWYACSQSSPFTLLSSKAQLYLLPSRLLLILPSSALFYSGCPELPDCNEPDTPVRSHHSLHSQLCSHFFQSKIQNLKTTDMPLYHWASSVLVSPGLPCHTSLNCRSICATLGFLLLPLPKIMAPKIHYWLNSPFLDVPQ